ncbi:MAG: glycosyltransferase family 4 protein [Candidatus Binatia bacterium]|nr:glycosyltransferase family 4 protein [Candidatus Binatia bacterium]
MNPAKKPKRILICGGLPQSLVLFRGTLIRELIERGIDVTACANGADATTSKKLKIWGARYYPLRIDRTGFNPISDVLYLFQLVCLIRKIQPDAILGYTHKPVIFSAIAGRICRVPIRCGWITGLGYAFMPFGGFRQKLARKFLTLLYMISLRFNTMVLFQNRDDAETFHALTILPDSLPTTITRGSGIDLEEYPKKPAPIGPPRVLLIARLLADKGIREFAEAIRIAKRNHPTLEADLVGPFDPNPAGIDESEVSAWVQEGLLRYHGNQDDVRPFLENCSVYVLPSYREGTPHTVLEAMATGRPIITTDTPGCRETVCAERNGFLIPLQDPRKLADAISELISSPELRLQMGEESRRIVEERFDAAIVNETVIAALELN